MSDFDPVEMAMRNTKLAADRDRLSREVDDLRARNAALSGGYYRRHGDDESAAACGDELLEALAEARKERDVARAALERIRHENHWTTVHQIIDEALKS